MPPPYARGHVRAPNKGHIIQISDLRNRHRLQALAPATEPAWDSDTNPSTVSLIDDQKSCGSCWDYSGTGIVETALIAAGVITPQFLSKQYTLDCGQNGGCNGDDNVTVLEWAKETGLPLDSDYGPYSAQAGRCRYKPAWKLYKIDDFIFADGASSNYDRPSDTQKIKDLIKRYGVVGCAVAAGSSWDGYDGSTVHTGNSTNIDHDVRLNGWQDTGTKVTAAVGGRLNALPSVTVAQGWWWMPNSWGKRWGLNGRMKIAYGADAIGTEAVAAVVNGGPGNVIDWSRI